MGIDSLRAEITWFEAGRAYAAADGREEVTLEDLKTVAPMALRLRRSQFMSEYFAGQSAEENQLNQLLNGAAPRRSRQPRASRKSHRK
jgi:magnesium chelatase subunit I